MEDPALLTGRGQFVDDLKLPGTLHAAFVRSPFAHARIRSLDAGRARAHPGVYAVIAAADLPADLRTRRLSMLVPNPAIKQPWTQLPLADGEVCYAGEPIAVVVADNRYIAEDAAALVDIDYEPLPAACDCRDALAAGAPAAHAGSPDNVGAAFTVQYGNVDVAFAGAALVVKRSVWCHRGGSHSMEGRGVLARYDALDQRITVWSATQSPHIIRRNLTDLLGLDEEQVRVIAPPDVGGGFGPKTIFYSEEAIVALAARLMGRPVKWIEDRREHFLSATQERDQYWDVEIALDAGGKILGVRGAMIHDTGAYLPWGIISPYISATTVPGPYIVPSFKLVVTVALTNKVATTPVRGAGRPQAVFAMERLMDAAARATGIDAAELRARNLIPPEQMPYKVGLVFRDGKPVVYDSGDYPRCQEVALRRCNYETFAERQRAARAHGRYIGIGIGNYVEGTGLGPFEGATVRIGPSGKIFVFTGGAPQGQGHQTTLAQLCADKFGVGIEHVQVVTGDTGKIANGVGTFASRIAVNAGSSVHLASIAVREKALKIASHMLEAAEEDLDIEDGRITVRGVPNMSLGLSDIAKAVAGMPGFALPGGVEPGLEATEYFSPSQAAYCNGSHCVEVEVDIETGHVQILKYAVAHDCGNLINPLVVDGQVQGAVAHGVGNALYEWMKYDADAQPVTTNLAEYLLPTAPETPRIVLEHVISPSPLNPIGVKGAGEGGTIPAAAAIVAAVENALSPFGIAIDDAPITPPRIVQLIAAARGKL